MAQYNLAVMYFSGVGVPQDRGEAAKWYGLAARQGNGNAQFNLGVMYQRGEGVAHNPDEAMHWFRLAADGGYAPAQAAAVR